MTKIPTGSNCIDQVLEGGIAPETITLIYGEPETGKSTLAMQCAVNCALHGKKVLYVDADNTFSEKRLSQLAQGKFSEVAELIILMRPRDFAEQTVLVDHLSEYIQKNFGLIVIDTFNSLYRAKVAETATRAKASFALNRELNRQMALLAQTAKTQKIPMVVNSQVRAVFDDTFVSVAPVATRVLQFWADTTIVLAPTENTKEIKATVKRNRNPQEATCYLSITHTGIHDNE